MKVNIGCPVVGAVGVGHVITKFSGMGRFTKLWGYARAWSPAINNFPFLGRPRVLLGPVVAFKSDTSH